MWSFFYCFSPVYCLAAKVEMSFKSIATRSSLRCKTIEKLHGNDPGDYLYFKAR